MQLGISLKPVKAGYSAMLSTTGIMIAWQGLFFNNPVETDSPCKIRVFSIFGVVVGYMGDYP